MMNAYGSYTLLEAIGRKKNLKILLAHLVGSAATRSDRILSRVDPVTALRSVPGFHR